MCMSDGWVISGKEVVALASTFSRFIMVSVPSNSWNNELFRCRLFKRWDVIVFGVLEMKLCEIEGGMISVLGNSMRIVRVLGGGGKIFILLEN